VFRYVNIFIIIITSNNQRLGSVGEDDAFTGVRIYFAISGAFRLMVLCLFYNIEKTNFDILEFSLKQKTSTRGSGE